MIRQARAARILFDTLSSMGTQANDVTEAEISSLHEAVKGARSVLADKELLKPANKVLALLQTKVDMLGSTQQVKYDSARKNALAVLERALGPPLRSPQHPCQR